MEDKISDLTDIGILAGEDEFLLIDKSLVSESSDGATKVNVSVLADAIVSRLPVDGSRGNKGNLGETGSKSDIIGDKGKHGDVGMQGPRGDRGVDGDDGDSGDVGIKGSRGQSGEHGDPGYTGEKGVSGDKGSKGYKGYMHEKSRGLRGELGDNGIKGQVGPTGERGEKGEPGNVNFGVKGFRGDIGESSYGSMGQLGSKGVKGEKGKLGDVGVEGHPFQYKKAPKRTIIHNSGRFQHARHLYQLQESPRDVYSVAWETDIVEHGQHNKRFLVFELESTFMSDYEYSRYLVEVDFEPFLFGDSTPVLNKTVLATSINDQTNGTINLDWFEGDDNKHYLSFFSVAVSGNNIQFLIKKIHTHTGTVNMGSQNIENFRI